MNDGKRACRIMDDLSKILQTPPEFVTDKVTKLMKRTAELEKEIAELRTKTNRCEETNNDWFVIVRDDYDELVKRIGLFPLTSINNGVPVFLSANGEVYSKKELDYEQDLVENPKGTILHHTVTAARVLTAWDFRQFQVCHLLKEGTEVMRVRQLPNGSKERQYGTVADHVPSRGELYVVWWHIAETQMHQGPELKDILIIG